MSENVSVILSVGRDSNSHSRMARVLQTRDFAHLPSYGLCIRQDSNLCRLIKSQEHSHFATNASSSCPFGNGYVGAPTPLFRKMWTERDSNPRTPKRPDLQSGGFNHSPICPFCAAEGNRTPIVLSYPA